MRLENIPAPTKSYSTLNHPKADYSPLLDSNHITIFQSILEVC